MPLGRALLYVATACGLALLVRTLLSDPPPLPIAVGALVGYAALVLAGVLVPRLQMFADVLCRGPSGARGVALTFDDGPDPVHTRSVLAALDRASAKATFFVLGAKAELHPDVVREIALRGHQIGVHGHVHDRLLALRAPKTVEADLLRALAAIEAITGTRPSYYRPAVGQTNARIARAAGSLGLTIVGWSVKARDGIATTPDAVVRRVVPRLRDGAIVLLHDAAEHDDRTPAAPQALDRILAAMDSRRLSAVRVDAFGDEPTSRAATRGA